MSWKKFLSQLALASAVAVIDRLLSNPQHVTDALTAVKQSAMRQIVSSQEEQVNPQN